MLIFLVRMLIFDTPPQVGAYIFIMPNLLVRSSKYDLKSPLVTMSTFC